MWISTPDSAYLASLAYVWIGNCIFTTSSQQYCISSQSLSRLHDSESIRSSSYVILTVALSSIANGKRAVAMVSLDLDPPHTYKASSEHSKGVPGYHLIQLRKCVSPQRYTVCTIHVESKVSINDAKIKRTRMIPNIQGKPSSANSCSVGQTKPSWCVAEILRLETKVKPTVRA